VVADATVVIGWHIRVPVFGDHRPCLLLRMKSLWEVPELPKVGADGAMAGNLPHIGQHQENGALQTIYNFFRCLGRVYDLC